MKTGKSDCRLVGIRQRQVEEGEILFGIGPGRRDTVLDDVEFDFVIEEIAARVVVDSERDGAVRRPLGRLALEFNAAVLVIVEGGGGGRNGWRFLVGVFRKGLRLVDDLFKGERRRDRGRVCRRFGDRCAGVA